MKRYKYEVLISRVYEYLADDVDDSPRLRAWRDLVLHMTAHSFVHRKRLPADEALARVWEEFEVAARGNRNLLFLGFWHHLICSMNPKDAKPFFAMLEAAFTAARADKPVLHYKAAVFTQPILGAGKYSLDSDPGETDTEAKKDVDWELVDQLLSGESAPSRSLPSAVKPTPTKVPHLQLIVGGRGFP